jgi:hypothetical protein
MRTKEIQIGTITEWQNFNQEVANKIIEKFQDINTDYDWYEFLIEHFTEKIEKLGFTVCTDEVQFSGFHSQGDGASFIGSVNILDYLKSTRQLTKYSALRRAIDNNLISEDIEIYRTNSHYSHEKTCALDSIEYYDEVTEKVENQITNLEFEIEEKREELAKDLYNDLYNEYNYLISEASIIETLIANEYDFDEDGDIVA